MRNDVVEGVEHLLTRNTHSFLHGRCGYSNERFAGAPAVFRAAIIPVEEDIVVNRNNSSAFPGDESRWAHRQKHQGSSSGNTNFVDAATWELQKTMAYLVPGHKPQDSRFMHRRRRQPSNSGIPVRQRQPR